MTTATRSTKTDKFGKSTRTYDTPHGSFVSVTTALQVMPKAFLLPWAAKLEREYVVGRAADLFESIRDVMTQQNIPRTWFESTLHERLGKKKAHKLALETAGDVGTRVHWMCEQYNLALDNIQSALGDEPESVDVEAEDRAFDAYRRWVDGFGFRPAFVEQIVYSKTHRYAGCLDVRGTVEGVDTLVDLKTGSGIWPEAHVQTSAYAYAHEEMGIPFPRQILIVRLPKKVGETEVEVVRVEDPAKEMRTFLAALALWRCLNRKGEE